MKLLNFYKVQVQKHIIIAVRNYAKVHIVKLQLKRREK